MKLEKPKHCDQDWLKMEPSKKGRICGKCQNELIDFRKKSWGEIRQIQLDSNNSTCGMYSKKQLKNWDPESKPSSKFTITAASVLFGMSQLIASDAIAQEDASITIQPQKTDPITNSPAQKKYVIEGTIIEESTAEPMPFVHVLNERTKKGASTDFDGKFRIEFTEDDFLQGKIELSIKLIGYQKQLRVIQKNSVFPLDLRIELPSNNEIDIIAFTVEVPSKRQERKYKRQQKREDKKNQKTE